MEELVLLYHKKGHSGIKEFFFLKALDEVDENVHMPQEVLSFLSKLKEQRKSSFLTKASQKVYDIVNMPAKMPSLMEIKGLVAYTEKSNIKLIRSVTIEKLSNKILRHFLSKFFLLLPFLLMVMLLSREALQS